MTIKRLILIVLTIIVVLRVSLSLIASWSQPQFQSRLELYQTNLLLQASEWQGGESQDSQDSKTVRNALVGAEPLKTAQEQYQDSLDMAKKNLQKAQTQLKALQSESLTPPVAPKPELPYPPVKEAASEKQQLQASVNQSEKLIDELDLRLGILKAEQGKTKAALQSWNTVIERHQVQLSVVGVKTAEVLVGLWQEPPLVVSDAQQEIENNLDGWFRDRALSRLYKVQQRQDALSTLQIQVQQKAEQAVIKLSIVIAIPGVGFVIGVGLLIFLLVQRLIQGKKSLLADNEHVSWSTPWDAEIIWQVFILGFFFVGQFIVPVLFSLLPIQPLTLDVRGKAFYVLLTYLLVAFGGLSVLYLSIKRFFPLPEGWFRVDWRGNWFLWGLGGYFAALPLVILVSLINQKLWGGQGGSNPILPIALQGRDSIALTVFFVTAAIAAPLFEELLFRGFLLPSLTRYMPVWGAIVLSGFLFAIAHLSLSEILPLATLGMILGIVYARSRNLLAPILLHSLWNSGTLLSLFILGSGAA